MGHGTFIAIAARQFDLDLAFPIPGEWSGMVSADSQGFSPQGWVLAEYTVDSFWLNTVLM